MFTIELPYPPSLNHYWRRFGNRIALSREGRQYRSAVLTILAGIEHPCFTGPIEITAIFSPPDRRVRDLDNLLKSVGDSVEHAGLIKNDSQIVHWNVWMSQPVRQGQARLQIRPLTPEEIQQACCN